MDTKTNLGLSRGGKKKKGPLYFSPEPCLTQEMWQGPPRINIVKQYKLCCPLTSVCLFSRENKESLIIPFASADEDLSLLITVTSPKLQSEPLMKASVQFTDLNSHCVSIGEPGNNLQ